MVPSRWGRLPATDSAPASLGMNSQLECISRALSNVKTKLKWESSGKEYVRVLRRAASERASEASGTHPVELMQLLLQSFRLDVFQQLDLAQEPQLPAAQRLLLATHAALQLPAHLPDAKGNRDKSRVIAWPTLLFGPSRRVICCSARTHCCFREPRHFAQTTFQLDFVSFRRFSKQTSEFGAQQNSQLFVSPSSRILVPMCKRCER